MKPNAKSVDELIIYIQVSDTLLFVYTNINVNGLLKKGEWNGCWWIVYEFSYLLILCISFQSAGLECQSIDSICVDIDAFYMNIVIIFDWAPTQPTLFMYSCDRLRFDLIRVGMEEKWP